jgi:hypothetical protein
VNRKPKKQARTSKFTLLLTKDELDQLHELADENGEPAAVLLRRLIKTTWRSYAEAAS